MHPLVYGVRTRPENSSGNLHPVLVAFQDAPYTYRIPVLHYKRFIIGHFYGKHPSFSHPVTDQLHIPFVGITGKTSGITDQLCQRFVPHHFIDHGAFYLSGDLYPIVIRFHFHNVVFFQDNILAAVAPQQVFVNVSLYLQFSVAVHFYIPQTSDFVDSSCRVQGVKDRGKGRQAVCSGSLHLAHDIDFDGAHISHRDLNERPWVGRPQIGIDPAEGRFDLGASFLDVHSLQVDRAYVGYVDVPVRADLLAYGQFAVSPYIYDDFIPRSQFVIFRGGHVHVGLEGQVLGSEQVFPENRYWPARRCFLHYDDFRFHRFRKFPGAAFRIHNRSCLGSALCLVIGIDPLGLFPCNAFGRQFGKYLLLRGPGGLQTLYFANDLLVTQLSVCHHCHQQKHGSTKKGSKNSHMKNVCINL
ncbi:MAG: hypothetical protein LMBGKNDO_01680 [Bacteroidales bacterium]|nr:hypothetical protein [Bacteroidales bacterium]